MTEQGVRTVLREAMPLLRSAAQTTRRALTSARHTASKAKGSAQVYLEYDLPNALERAFAPGGYSKAERELLEYGSVFEPSRRDFWGSSARDFLVHPTRTAHSSRSPYVGPAPSYTVPSDPVPFSTLSSGESLSLFPDLAVSTRPTQVPLWDVRGNTSSHVSSMFREASSTRPLPPPLKQASLFPDTPSYVVQRLDIKMPKARALRAEAIPEGSKLIPLGKPGRFMFDNVEFRAVRDLSHLSVDELRYMAKFGNAPKLTTGETLHMHHHNQQYHRSTNAFVVEIPQSLHSTKNRIQHPLGQKGGLGADTAERKDWIKIRTDFHKERAKTELLRRGVFQ